MHVFTIITAAVTPFLLGVFTSAADNIDPHKVPENTWVQVQQTEQPVKYLSSIWYMPATDEFICWGKQNGALPQSIYGVETFSTGDMRWQQSFPLGKEKSWANQRYPNWPMSGQTSRLKSWKGPHVDAADQIVAGFMQRNVVSFVETEGILRPTRCPTFYQGCWDSKRNRMVYFVGGKTFAYDPVKRRWTHLKPQASPDWCEYLVWASLCYDPHNDEVVLFGGGMAMNAWGGARTWIYDCEENTWKRPNFGTPTVSKLRAELEAIAEKLRDARGRLQYDLGQDAKVRQAALSVATQDLQSISGRLKALAKRLADQKQSTAETRVAKVADKLDEIRGTSDANTAHALVQKLKTLQSDLNYAQRPLLAEPPLRCNSQMVYDAKNQQIVLFGGDSQTASLADTWVYNVKSRTWSERHPETSPPPAAVVTATYVDKHGLVVAAGFEGEKKTCSAWAYDAAKNTWMPLAGVYDQGSGWHSIAYSPQDDLLLLNTDGTKSWGGARTAYVYRLNPATARADREGVTAGAKARVHFDFDTQMRELPAPDVQAQAKKLAGLPVNQWVEMPGVSVPKKGWGSATLDTDRSVILYIGGGHSTYSGTDTAHYDIGTGRWSISYPPEFPPFMRGTSRTVYGWSYNLHPWAEHTRKWYAYDPVSKMMVYIRQGSIRPGDRMHLGVGKGGIVEATGYATWVYNPRLSKWYVPACDRPFGTGDSDRLISTPHGVYANNRRDGVWHCTVNKVEEGDEIRYEARWKQVHKTGPGAGNEFDATVYDSKRNRLIQLSGSGEGKYGAPQMTFFDLETYQVQQAQPKGNWRHFRDACYIPGQDVIFTPSSYKTGGYYVYRCAENQWAQVDIASPKLTVTYNGKKQVKTLNDSGPDTVILYDPRHQVLFRYGHGDRVHLLHYDDKTANVRRY